MAGFPRSALLPGGIVGNGTWPPLSLLAGRHFAGNLGFMFRILDPVLVQGVAQPLQRLFPVAFGAFLQRDEVAFSVGFQARRGTGPGGHFLRIFGGGHVRSSSEEERAGQQKEPAAVPARALLCRHTQPPHWGAIGGRMHNSLVLAGLILAAATTGTHAEIINLSCDDGGMLLVIDTGAGTVSDKNP